MPVDGAFDAKFIREVLARHFQRVELIRLAGGISAKAACEGALIPQGWVMDVETDFYIPPGFEPNESIH